MVGFQLKIVPQLLYTATVLLFTVTKAALKQYLVLSHLQLTNTDYTVIYTSGCIYSRSITYIPKMNVKHYKRAKKTKTKKCLTADSCLTCETIFSFYYY